MKHQLLLILAILFRVSLNAQGNNVILEAKTVPKPSSTDAVIKQWNINQANFSKLSATGKDFFYWTNYSRKNPKRFWDSVVVAVLQAFPNLYSNYSESLKKDLYNQVPLPLLKLNAKLLETAQAHATDISIHKGKPGHISTDGRTFTDRITAAGIKNCAGENVSIGNVDPIVSLVLLYIDYGIPTLGHRKALLNPDYVETGIGVGNYSNDGTIFIVQDFSCAQ